MKIKTIQTDETLEMYKEVMTETHTCLFCVMNHQICDFHRDILEELCNKMY